MKRTKLKLESLRVDSFEAGRCLSPQRGTVRAMQPENQDCPPVTYPTDETYASDWWCGAEPTATGCVDYPDGYYVMTPLC